MKAIFTTGEAAEICRVSQQTIIRCFDAGRLKGFKVPGSKFRRIPRSSLLEFMKEHGIPLEAIDNGKPKVLVVGCDAADVIRAYGGDARYEMRAACSGYEAGLITQEFAPDVILLGSLPSAAEQLGICRSVQRRPELQHIRVYASAKSAGACAEQLAKAGAIISSDDVIDLAHAEEQLRAVG